MDCPWFDEYPKGVPREIDCGQYNSLVDIFKEVATRHPNNPAFANMGAILSYSEIDQKSRDFASFLQNRLKLKKGDRLAIMLPNLLQYPIALLGTLKAGLIVVSVNPLYTPRELKHQLQDSGAKAIVILENFAHKLEQVITDTDIRNVITTEAGDQLDFLKSKLINLAVRYVKKGIPSWNIPNTIKFNEALSEGAKRKYIEPELTNDDIALLQYTGGTTGVSKGAILTHKNVISNVLMARAWVGKKMKQGKEVMVAPLPLYHIFSLTANCFFGISFAALNVLITNPKDTESYIKELRKWPVTFVSGVNTLYSRLVNSGQLSTIDFSHLKIALSGGMATTKATATSWKKATGCTLIEAYGLSEASPAVCINPPDLEDYNGYIGLPIPSTQIKLINNDEEEVSLNKTGELCVKGPQVTQGYWNNPEETKALFTKDGWLKTGDIATVTDKGYIKLLDRKKDMILVSGFNVFPNEIEDIVGMHKGVLEVAALGVPDPKAGEVVKVFVVKKDPYLTKEQLMAHCRDNLTGYKRPRYIEFRDELPKSNVGKILRRELRE